MNLPGFLLEVLGELLAPNACAACDEPVRPRILFCEACASTVLPAEERGAVFAYGGAIATAIARLKYRGRPDLAPRLAAAMLAVARAADVGGADADVVVPVPLHPRRLAERGYNQAALLAGPIAKRLRVPHAPRALERVRDTPRQMELARAAREANVAGAFACGVIVERRRVLLVDDVTTTGATLAACEKALRARGAASVATLALARKERSDA